jgi:hypothetical protein
MITTGKHIMVNYDPSIYFHRFANKEKQLSAATIHLLLPTRRGAAFRVQLPIVPATYEDIS